MYSCGGRVGIFLGIKLVEGSPQRGNICRILAYSLKPNDFEVEAVISQNVYSCSTGIFDSINIMEYPPANLLNVPSAGV
jgi:hypothetical protein